MADIDPETIERVVRWCAEAGRQATAAEIRRALAPLSWDDLLHAQAILADPPPARPLGPKALADMARGAPPDVAAERERAGRYLPEEDLPAEPGAAPAAKPARSRPPRRAEPGVVIRRARDRIPPAPAPAPALPPAADLLRPEGRALLERLFRRLGARRAQIAAELARGWRKEDGSGITEADLGALLDHHGMARAFERRECDEMLHALRACGGVRAAAAQRLGLDPAGLDAALSRLGATEAAERIREERRADLRKRATLAERVRLLLVDEPRLLDLGLLAEWEADLRLRLPEHVRALRAGTTALTAALAASLGVTIDDARALVARLGVALGEDAPAEPPAPRRPASPGRPRGQRPAGSGKPRGPRPARPGNPREQRLASPGKPRGPRPDGRKGGARHGPAPRRGRNRRGPAPGR